MVTRRLRYVGGVRDGEIGEFNGLRLGQQVYVPVPAKSFINVLGAGAMTPGAFSQPFPVATYRVVRVVVDATGIPETCLVDERQLGAYPSYVIPMAFVELMLTRVRDGDLIR